MTAPRAAAMSPRRGAAPATSAAFFGRLRWLDGRPLLDTIEPYRRAIFSRALDERGPDDVPTCNLVLAGRAKKNWKTADLILAGLFCLLIRESPQGNDCFVLANDEGQAADDLSLAKKLISINPDLRAELEVLAKEIRRIDGHGTMRILPANNAVGQHGKTSLFVGFDEIHGYREWDLLEALQPDPSRPDALCWITSYDTIFDSPGVPLHDLKEMGKRGDDPRMLFSWYSADFCTDPTFAELPPDERANPSMSSWPQGRRYLEQQRRRLPSNRFRRLHHNLPGAPGGAFFDQQIVNDAVVPGRVALEPRAGVDYAAFVDMSGGSNDDAVLAIGHAEEKRTVLDLIVPQAGGVPFNPRSAVARFADFCKRYDVRRVTGDSYAGETFRSDFAQHGMSYVTCAKTASQLYEDLEVVLNGGAIELLDNAKLIQQLCTLVVRGAKVDHLPNAHDDFANAAAGVIVSLAVPTAADGWIEHARGLAERARQAQQVQDDDDEPPPSSRRGSEPPPPDNQVPESLRNNPVTRAYFAALRAARGTSAAVATPPCAHCGRETVGTRLTDGVRAWCDAGCQARWITARAEKNRAREVAENGGLPLTA